MRPLKATNRLLADRRRLPMVAVRKDYGFTGSDGELRLELFEGRTQQRGWTFPWYSSYGSDFNYDFAVTLDESVTPPTYNYKDADELRELGFAPAGEFPGRSSFLRTADGIFHTYSVYARGTESIGGSYYLLDETALGRQEEWEEPKGRVTSARSPRRDFAS
jgi:predicted dithiol-disulfide oxidoreductase (DUF899 family)